MMRTRQRVWGMGPIKVGVRWADAYFRREYVDADEGGRPEDDVLTVRFSLADYNDLHLARGEPVRLYLPGCGASDVRVRVAWSQSPFMWVEFEPAAQEFPRYLYREG
jgi:hypothetical protein